MKLLIELIFHSSLVKLVPICGAKFNYCSPVDFNIHLPSFFLYQIYPVLNFLLTQKTITAKPLISFSNISNLDQFIFGLFQKYATINQSENGGDYQKSLDNFPRYSNYQ